MVIALGIVAGWIPEVLVQIGGAYWPSCATEWQQRGLGTGCLDDIGGETPVTTPSA